MRPIPLIILAATFILLAEPASANLNDDRLELQRKLRQLELELEQAEKELREIKESPATPEPPKQEPPEIKEPQEDTSKDIPESNTEDIPEVDPEETIEVPVNVVASSVDDNKLSDLRDQIISSETSPEDTETLKKEAQDILRELSSSNIPSSLTDPRDSGLHFPELYDISLIKVTQEGTKVFMEGTGPSNTTMVLHVFSSHRTYSVKTNEDGSWSYVITDDIEKGEHTAYLSNVNDSGSVITKSDPFPFGEKEEEPEDDINSAPVEEEPDENSNSLILIAVASLGLIGAIAILVTKKRRP